MVDIGVKDGAAWVCHAPERRLDDVLLPVNISSKDDGAELSQLEGDQTNASLPVLLEQTEEGSPCVLIIHCNHNPPTNITHLLVISEARTMEVYDQMGEYCGTVRGQREDGIQPDRSEDRGPFYRKQLALDHPSSACDVKLLSLAGRSSVSVWRVVVGLQSQQPCPVRGPGIDMQQVQCLVQEMGSSLSPGAQNLMEMVQFQQKNQTGSLGGFLPLLMSSGAFSALAREGNVSSAAVRHQPQSANSMPIVESVKPPDQVLASQNGTTSADSSCSSPDPPQTDASSDSRRPMSYAQLAEMMSHFLEGQGHEPSLSCGPELLPILQSVCGQVTQLRLDEAVVTSEKEKLMRNGTWELDSAMERRLEEMERRLKEHLDRRLDALEQKLEAALLSTLPLVALNQGAVSSSGLGAASPGPTEQTAPAMH